VAAVRRLAPGIAYQSLAQLLRDAIAQGDFSDGLRLPTEAQLSADYGVSRQTVRRALEELTTEGLIFRVRGRGTFATPQSSGQYLRSIGSVEDLLALSVDSVMETVRPLQRRADVVAAGRLRADSDQVMTGLFRRMHDGVPFSITEVSVPLAVGQRIVESGALLTPGEVLQSTVIGLVDEMNREPIAGAHQSITAAGVPPDLAEYIDRNPDDHVLRIDRLYFDAVGRPLELAVSYFNPERYSYRLELRRRIGARKAG
jgi:GntR family transcriptional regulator